MGCNTSRIDHLPAVSLCRDRCKFLDEALHQSHAFTDAHLAYMHSLNSLAPSLHSFFHLHISLSSSPIHDSPAATVVEPNPSKSSSSPDHCLSSSNSESSLLDERSDSEEEEEEEEKDFDLLNRINPNYFHHQTLSTCVDSCYYPTNRAWKTPSPPAPSASSWDFLNFFETYERYELLKMDKESINNDAKIKKPSKNHEKLEGDKKKRKKQEAKVAEVDSVKVVSAEEQNKEQKNSVFKESTNRSVSEILKEIEVQFERASESGHELLNFLDTSKFQYYRISSKLSHADTQKTSSVLLNLDEDDWSLINLSSTIKKLCIWEKKLYDEVKAEEKLRIMYARYCRQMKSFAEKGVKANKVDSTRTLLRTISTKIKVAIQVIDRISVSISKLRDEELWPQILQFIQKLLEMWKAMAECHRCQWQAILEARNLDAFVSSENFNDAYLEATIQLRIELQNWNWSFSNWMTVQRSCVKALNGWLLKCLPQGHEEKPDSLPPFSPEKTGTPPMFTFCNQLSHAMNSVSEMEVIENINGLLMSLNQILEQNYAALQQRAITEKDTEKKVKILEREEQKLQKLLQTRGKKMLSPEGFQNGNEKKSNTNNNLDVCVKQIFMALDKFSAKSVQVYEELHVQIEESISAGDQIPEGQ